MNSPYNERLDKINALEKTHQPFIIPTTSARRELMLRDMRVPFDGGIRLIIPFGGMALTLPLRGVNLSASGVLTTANIGRLEQILRDRLPPKLLTENDTYTLQLDHDFGHLPPLLLECRLVRRELLAAEWVVAFSFLTATPELLSLLHLIAKGPHEPQTN